MPSISKKKVIIRLDSTRAKQPSDLLNLTGFVYISAAKIKKSTRGSGTWDISGATNDGNIMAILL
jgi:hypothetical protein